MFGKRSLYQLVVVSQDGKNIGFLHAEMINELRPPKPIGIAFDAFDRYISFKTFSDFPAQ